MKICLVLVEHSGNDRLYELWGYCDHGKRVNSPALYRGAKPDSVARGRELRDANPQRKFLQSQVYVLPIMEGALTSPWHNGNGAGQYPKP